MDAGPDILTIHPENRAWRDLKLFQEFFITPSLVVPQDTLYLLFDNQ